MLKVFIIKTLSPGVLFKNLFVPLATLVVYATAFAFLAPRFIPESVNTVFASRLGKYSLYALVGVSVVMLVSFLIIRKNGLSSSAAERKISLSDLSLLILPLIPLAQYLITNREILAIWDGLVVVGFFALFSSLFIYAIPALLSKISLTRVMMSLGLAFAFTLIIMGVLSRSFSWYEVGSMKIQLPVFTAVFLAGWVITGIENKQLVFLLLTVMLLANSSLVWLTQVRQTQRESQPDAETPLQQMIGGRLPRLTPNIYLLVYDSYVASETMTAYGIDNRRQEDHLTGQGFVLYPQAYSVGADTLETMSKVLNATTEDWGRPRRALAGDGLVHQALRSIGYTTYGVFPYDYMFRGVGSSYDFTVPAYKTQPSMHLISAILMGEFKFDIGFKEQTAEGYVDTKHSLLAGIESGPIFFYAHSTLPGHSQNSGTCLPNEIDLFAERLAKANAEMRKDIAIILEHDPEALIIVAGDHGPYLTKNCTVTHQVYDLSEITRLDIQDRYGTFLAVRWPEQGNEAYDDINVIQDLFPAILAYLYRDPSFLELTAEPVMQNIETVSGATVIEGLISGGVDDGEPLFLLR